MLKILTLHILLVLSVGSATSFDPFAPGPFAVERTNYKALWNQGLKDDIDVWVPDTQQELTTPIIYFMGAFGGIVGGYAYETIFTRVASYGFTVIQPWINGNNPIDNYEGVWLDDVMTWVEVHLKSKFDNEGIAGGVVLDHRNLFIMGHSAGSHIVVEYLKHHCSDVKGQILFSPVDGFDPYGVIDLEAITPGQFLNYATPTLVMMAGLDSVKGINNLGDLVPACAPKDMANLRFYDAMPEHTWLINATEYGHADAMEDSFQDIVSLLHFCASGDKDLSRDAYRDFVAGEVVSFIKYLQGDCSVAQYMEDPDLMPVATLVQQKGSIAARTELCSKAECRWQEAPFPHP